MHENDDCYIRKRASKMNGIGTVRNVAMILPGITGEHMVSFLGGICRSHGSY